MAKGKLADYASKRTFSATPEPPASVRADGEGPLLFVLPHDASMRPVWMIRCGLFMYDHLGGRITLPGSIYLATIALIPSVVLAIWGISQFPFGGTSILITVGVALETMKQLESQLLMRHYEGFLK